MKNNYTVFKATGLALIALLSMNVSAQSMEFNDNEYKIIERPGVTWSDANALAQMMGDEWHLATITSADEQRALQQLLSDKQGEYWLGARLNAQMPENNQWQWVTGEAFEYSNWHPEEPNNFWSNDEHHLGAWGVRNWTWNDEGNLLNISGYVLEREASNQSASVDGNVEPLMNIYPNPNQGQFTLDFTGDVTNDSYTVEVVNVLGKIVMTKEITTSNGHIRETFGGNNLNPGTYWVQVSDNSSKATQKMVITK